MTRAVRARKISQEGGFRLGQGLRKISLNLVGLGKAGDVVGFAIDQVLLPDHVILDAPCSSFEDCLVVLGECVGRDDACRDAALFLEQVRVREAVSSTVTKSGVAFPHTRSEVVERLFIIALRTRTAIAFSGDLPPVALVFLLGVPLDSPGEYLECMALLSRKLKDPKVLATLTTTLDPEEFVRTLVT